MPTLVQQIIRFILVGGLATLIDFLVLAFLYHGLNLYYLIGTVIAFIVSTIFNYWASMRFIFKSKYGPDQRHKEFIIFLILSLIGLALTSLLMVLAVDWLGLPVMFAKVLVTGFVMVFNFVSRKLFIEGR
ncbi:GtrA family protein [Hutsoniella sourekii]|uniref:GtrA family protein n=1 Tax=Hutsoniella sourekii TaxID=87650 RepID=UPI000484F566|nr:GtrA family protein [Hutsoniella sourekii]